jgi:hypothetical protein
MPKQLGAWAWGLGFAWVFWGLGLGVKCLGAWVLLCTGTNYSKDFMQSIFSCQRPHFTLQSTLDIVSLDSMSSSIVCRPICGPEEAYALIKSLDIVSGSI